MCVCLVLSMTCIKLTVATCFHMTDKFLASHQLWESILFREWSIFHCC